MTRKSDAFDRYLGMTADERAEERKLLERAAGFSWEDPEFLDMADSAQLAELTEEARNDLAILDAAEASLNQSRPEPGTF